MKRRAWGIELGRRYRDAIRKRRWSGLEIDAWQFDELLGQCASSAAHREFIGGVLVGLAKGRGKLGDRLEPGFVWCAFTALTRLPGPNASAALAQFWRDLDQAALFIVGEEYPFFRGAPADAAGTTSEGHHRLVSLHPQLAQRYIVGMTPGFLVSDGLKGNPPPRKSMQFVNGWRRGFIEARNGLVRPGGYGQFHFVKDNADPEPLRAALATLHFANGKLVH